VVDSDGELTEPGDLVDVAPGVEREFVEPLLEIKTTPCESTAAMREELVDRLERVLERAQANGKRLVPLATPLHCGNVTDRPSDRTRIQRRIIGEDFEYVRHCAGTHVHVEQQPGSEVDQLNALVALDPALALVNSSSHYRGRHLADGARSKLYRWLAYDDLPHQGRLWPYVQDTDEWTRRLERRYEEFETAALENGVDRPTVAAHFDPESAVWTPVQLRAEFGTVEWRSPDTALPSQVVQLADDVAGIVERLRDAEVRIDGDTPSVTGDEVVIPRFETVLEHVHAAIRDGLESSQVASYLDAFGFDIDSYEPMSREFDSRATISHSEACDRRLAYADRLENDLGQARSISAD
jgi:carboxylate-amine ligase